MEDQSKDSCKPKTRNKLIAGAGGTLGVISLLGLLGAVGLGSVVAFSSQQQAGTRPAEGDLAIFFDPEMGGCEKACGYHGKTDQKKISGQPGAKIGDLVRCPVSGVVFEVKPESAQVTLNGKRYFTCCPSCAVNFEQKKKVLGKT